MVKKYSGQQKNVRNNREFNSLSKETEYQELEIELAEKRIKEFKAKIEQKNELIAATKENIAKQNAIFLIIYRIVIYFSISRICK